MATAISRRWRERASSSGPIAAVIADNWATVPRHVVKSADELRANGSLCLVRWHPHDGCQGLHVAEILGEVERDTVGVRGSRVEAGGGRGADGRELAIQAKDSTKMVNFTALCEF